MSERLSPRPVQKGTDAAKLHKWAMIFLAAGVLGRAILQNALLGYNSLTSEELLAAVDAIPGGMVFLSGALVCQLAQTCAAPLLAFLLVEGYQRTGSFEKYLVRAVGLAMITELPYNLAINGSLLYLGTRNPAFSLVIGLVMLHLFNRFSEKGIKNTLVKLVIFVAAFLWCQMLRIDHGACFIIFVGALWLARNRSNLRSLYGFCGAMVCVLFDPYYIASCLACIMFHRYNEEKGEQNRTFNYAFYPVCLLVLGIVAKFL